MTKLKEKLDHREICRYVPVLILISNLSLTVLRLREPAAYNNNTNDVALIVIFQETNRFVGSVFDTYPRLSMFMLFYIFC